jgi:formylglycine-generating enzyme required for sulfatase activity/pectin methylesterase-like acyl-CoA thioesterase
MRQEVFAGIGIAVCILLFTASANAATISVPADYSTIQAAINAATGGDEIVVSPGVYYEQLASLSSNITLRSLDPLDPETVAATIVDASYVGSVLTLTGTETEAFVIDGLTLTHGRSIRGAAIAGYDAQPIIRNCRIIENLPAGTVLRNERGGGAIWACHGLIDNNEINYNDASELYASSSEIGQAALYECNGTIKNNRITHQVSASAIKQCHGDILGNHVLYNELGGAIYADGRIANNRFMYNGGSVVKFGELLENNIIAHNRCTNAAVDAVDVVRNNIIAYNINLTGLGSNSAGGLERVPNGSVINCIVWKNEPINTHEPDAFSYCCVSDWTGDSTGVIDLDPQFIWAEGGVFRLQPTSPCIDAGVAVPLNEDIAGIPRPFIAFPGEQRGDGSGFDIGAHEYEFIADATAPDQPINSSPVEATQVSSLTPELRCSAFSSQNPEALHQDSEWQVATDIGFTQLVWDSDWNTVDKTSIDVLKITLYYETTYFWRIRHRDQNRIMSPWSEATSFSTPPAPMLLVPQQYPTIQAAIDAAANGVEIIVATGRYVENINFGGKSITLRSTDPTNTAVVEGTVLDGNGQGSVVTFDGVESASTSLSGFTITGGCSPYGGGILGNGCLATVQYNRIVSNTAEVPLGEAAQSYLDGSGGGAAYCDGMIQYNTFEDNHAHSYYDDYLEKWTEQGWGGALYHCKGTIQNNRMVDNRAGIGAAGGQCEGTFAYNLVESNTATHAGGGLYECNGSINNNHFLRNHAGGEGGALGRCRNYIGGNLIAENSAEEYAGVSYVYGVFENNTVVGNTSTRRGGIYIRPDSVIRNNIVWGNSPFEEQIYPNRTRSNMHNCLVPEWIGGGTGNLIGFDPLLIDVKSGNYRLQITSPCINAGTNIAEITIDLDGNERPIGTALDLGAYEFDFEAQGIPDTPIPISPVGGAVNQPLQAVLICQPFSSSIPNTTHADSQWQVDITPDFDPPLFSSEWIESSKTQFIMPANLLNHNSSYYWRVAHRDNRHIASHWSTPEQFLTIVVGTLQRVPENYPTIQAAIDVATGGFEIIVSPGLYVENINFQGKDIVLRSTDPSDPAIVAQTIIDGSHSGSVVSFAGTETQACTLSGFTLTHGLANRGGGIHGADAMATIINNVIVDNTATTIPDPAYPGGVESIIGLGGGLYKCDGLIESNIITGNNAVEIGMDFDRADGGGLFGCGGNILNNEISSNQASSSGGGLKSCNALIANNLIKSNTARSSVSQGGGGLSTCSGTIRGNSILENDSHQGGGLYGCNGLIENNRIEGNYARNGGGLRACNGIILNNWILRNITSGGGGGGCYRCDGTIIGNLIAENSSGYYGSALGSCDGAIINNTIVGNIGMNGGSKALNYCEGTILNCIIWGNGQSSSAQSDALRECAIPDYCLLQGEQAAQGIGNLYTDPLLVDPAQGNYQLMITSPCIDQATDYVLASPDLLGTSRPIGNGYDMGAFEFDPLFPTPTSTPTMTYTITPTLTPTPTRTPTPSFTPTPHPEEIAFYVLDDYGAVHTGGAANQVMLTGGPYFGWDIARAMELVFGLPTTNDSHIGAAVLDGYGALHTLSCVRPTQSFYFLPEPGDVAVDLALFQEDLGGVAGNIGFYALDRKGTLWPGGIAQWHVAMIASVSPELDGVTVYAVDVELADDTGKNGWIMDNKGNVYEFGNAKNPNFPASLQTNWIDFEVVEKQLLRMDTSGQLVWSSTPIVGWELPMVDGDLLIDFEVEPGRGLVATDRYGAIYTSGTAITPGPGEGPPYFGFEAALDLEIGPPFGGMLPPPPPNIPTPSPGIEEMTIHLPNLPAGAKPLVLVKINPGSFMMGRYPGEQDSYSEEDSRHQVNIGYQFYIGKYEITKAQWEAVTNTTPWAGQRWVLDNQDCPVVYESWDDIRSTTGFLDKLNALGQGIFRLPSEAEWEYCCRAGTTTRFYWGDDLNYTGILDYAWCDSNAWSANEKYAHVVGLKLPNVWGLYDMSGNAWEWCEDDWHNNYSGEARPDDGSAWIDSPRALSRVARGGSWGYSGDAFCRSAYRAAPSTDNFSFSYGLRVVWTP